MFLIGFSKEIIIYDLNKNQELKRFNSVHTVWNSILLSNGDLLTVDYNCKIKLWNLLEP